MRLLLCGCLTLLLTCLPVKADFIFEFEIIRHITNGDCFGIDFTIPCETFVGDFCLRDGSYFESTSQDLNLCTLGYNGDRVFEVIPGVRTIESTEYWDGFFQLFITAHDDDYPLVTTDILDYIFISRIQPANNIFSETQRVFGINNKVGVDIRYRVRCAENHYRGDCTQFCVARDDETGHYTCHANDGTLVCNPAYEHPETNCVDLITVCNESPCVRGTCNPIGQLEFNCTCPVGYTGMTCESDINECLTINLCQNSGSCTDLSGSYACNCVPGYEGDNCQDDINECLWIECVGNATCIDGVNQYECVCNSGFEGLNCIEINPCDSSPCALTGTCVPLGPFQYMCQCNPGFTGSVCETNINDCINVNCTTENTICLDGVQFYTCECMDGFDLMDGNCTLSMIIPAVGSSALDGTVIGAAVGVLVGLILIFLIIIVIVIALVVAKKGKKKDYSIPEENTYEERPSPTEPDVFSQSAHPLVSNPMYSTRTLPEPIPTAQDSLNLAEFNVELSPAYSTIRDVNNPLYGSDSVSSSGPIYSDPVTLKAKQPTKEADNYPYSYAMVDKNRRPNTTVKAPLPNYEQAVLDGPSKVPEAKQRGPEYEEIVLKPKPTPRQGVDKRTQSGYEIPLNGPVSSSPLVYHYATNNSKPPKLREAVSTAKKNPHKKSIYDSQDDDASIVVYQRPKPVPPPRPNLPAAENPTVYSYATTGRTSVKIQPEQPDLPPYNKLEHNLGPDVSNTQIRLAKVEDSGYDALETD